MNIAPDWHWQLLVLIVKKTAEQNGHTPETLSEATGIRKATIERIWSLKFAPSLKVFTQIMHAAGGVNIFFEEKSSKTDLNKVFEAAMTELGRRPDNLPKN